MRKPRKEAQAESDDPSNEGIVLFVTMAMEQARGIFALPGFDQKIRNGTGRMERQVCNALIDSRVPELKAVIDSTKVGNLSFLVTEFGKPFSSNGFGNWFRKRCDEAGLFHCAAHGLRKAGASIAAENGATERQLMAIFGWSTMKEAARYTKAARQRVLAASGMKLLIPDQK